MVDKAIATKHELDNRIYVTAMNQVHTCQLVLFIPLFYKGNLIFSMHKAYTETS